MIFDVKFGPIESIYDFCLSYAKFKGHIFDVERKTLVKIMTKIFFI